MFCWEAEFRAGPPGCSDDVSIRSGWFETLERAKEDAMKNSGVQVFSYPFFLYSQYKLSFVTKEEGIERRLGEPQFFTFLFNTGSLLVYSQSVQVKVAKARKAEPPKQQETEDAQGAKEARAGNESANTTGIPTTIQQATQGEDPSKAALRHKLKRKQEGDLPRAKRGRPKGSKNKPKPTENKDRTGSTHSKDGHECDNVVDGQRHCDLLRPTPVVRTDDRA